MGVDEDFPWLCSMPTETLESLGWHFKQTEDRIILLDVAFCQITFGFQNRYLFFTRHIGN